MKWVRNGLRRWRGQPVALLEVLGGSRDVERSMQRLVAEHPELSRHPHVVRVLGETEEPDENGLETRNFAPNTSRNGLKTPQNA